ncbi:MAG: hypothetical protein IKZ50_01560 [Bacteroidales bacterium]|nr:hypothetical protein [Bacteroidales bacterium]
MPKIFLLRKSCNATVTSHNFDIMNAAAAKCGCEVFDGVDLAFCKKKGSKFDIYVATTLSDVIGLYVRGKKKIFFWVQGIIPEESYMRHQSKLRLKVLSVMEKYALKSSKFIAFVSKAMEEHYNEKYKMSFQGKSMVFPCYNAYLDETAFTPKEKYKNNVFVYAGGLAEWQCFDEMLDIYRRIEEITPDTKLLILTKDKATATKKIEKRGIQNYEIGFVAKEELPQVLASAKFGFVIRKDNPVNKVSTPTKISSYLSCGLIPIFGDSIKSFKLQSEDMNYAIPWNMETNDLSGVLSMMKKDIDNADVLAEYKKVFDRYFSDDKYISEISNIFLELAK